jgi:hypothetical protein
LMFQLRQITIRFLARFVVLQLLLNCVKICRFVRHCDYRLLPIERVAAEK